MLQNISTILRKVSLNGAELLQQPAGIKKRRSFDRRWRVFLLTA